MLPLRKGDDIAGMHTIVFRDSAPPLEPTTPQLALGIAQLASLALETTRLVEAMNAADRLKTEFLANLSHELRTPLNVIIGYNEMLLDGGAGRLNDEQDAILGRAQHNARELLALMGAALELSRDEGRGMPLVLEPVSIALLVDNLSREVAALPPIPGVAFESDVPTGLPPIFTDALKLRMILKNLVDNARKFTEKGRIAISASAVNGGVELAVSDTGYGIPAEELARILSPSVSSAAAARAASASACSSCAGWPRPWAAGWTSTARSAAAALSASGCRCARRRAEPVARRRRSTRLRSCGRGVRDRGERAEALGLDAERRADAVVEALGRHGERQLDDLALVEVLAQGGERRVGHRHRRARRLVGVAQRGALGGAEIRALVVRGDMHGLVTQVAAGQAAAEVDAPVATVALGDQQHRQQAGVRRQRNATVPEAVGHQKRQDQPRRVRRELQRPHVASIPPARERQRPLTRAADASGDRFGT